MITAEISKEAEAARVLLLNVRDVLIGDDDAVEDVIEGETNFKEIAAKAVARLAEIDAMVEAISMQTKNLSARLTRLEAQGASIRAALVSAMATLDLTKLEIAQGTLSRKPTPPKVVVTDEALIPADFWKRPDPTLDRRALLAALKERQDIPGATLSNGGETLAVRWK
jgi:hypothetical protein